MYTLLALLAISPWLRAWNVAGATLTSQRAGCTIPNHRAALHGKALGVEMVGVIWFPLGHRLL